jgi:sentrin-specific protease 1
VSEAALPAILKRIIVWNTFFWSKLIEDCRLPDGTKQLGFNFLNVRRWTLRPVKVNIMDMEMIVIPINHHTTHWALAALWPATKEVCYMDSLGSSSEKHVTSTLLRWVKEELQDKWGVEEDVKTWKIRPPPDDLPQQHNGCDCGAFTCMFANYVSLGLEMHMGFRQRNMNDLRRFIGHAIMSKSLPLPTGM